MKNTKTSYDDTRRLMTSLPQSGCFHCIQRDKYFLNKIKGK